MSSKNRNCTLHTALATHTPYIAYIPFLIAFLFYRVTFESISLGILQLIHPPNLTER